MQDIHFKLFHGPALRSARVKWLLHELLGERFALEVLDTYEAEQYRADYLTINPNHAVPTLQITWPDGAVTNMIESAAMVALLADTFAEAKLSPDPRQLTAERVDYLQVLHFGATIDWILWQIRLHTHILAEDQKEPRTVRRYASKFAAEIEPQLQSRLDHHAFICGDTFSAADCVIGHGIAWAMAYGLCKGECFAKYLGRLALRPAYQLAFADAGGFMLEVPRDKPVVRMVSG